MKKRKIAIIKGIGYSYLNTLVMICILSLVYTYTQVSEEFTPIIMKLNIVVSIAIGTFISSKNLRNKGWLNGVIIGMTYTLILVIIGAYLKGNVIFVTKNIGKVIVNMFIGIIFGIIGVNVIIVFLAIYGVSKEYRGS